MALGLPNAGWLLLITNVGALSELRAVPLLLPREGRPDRAAIPFVNSIRRHHIAHHNPALMMERNFNLTYPVADWFFGTSDLACGLLRHVFNGTDTRFVRTDLKRVRAGADDPAIGHARTAAVE